jgi:hypothetical protein
MNVKGCSLLKPNEQLGCSTLLESADYGQIFARNDNFHLTYMREFRDIHPAFEMLVRDTGCGQIGHYLAK